MKSTKLSGTFELSSFAFDLVFGLAPAFGCPFTAMLNGVIAVVVAVTAFRLGGRRRFRLGASRRGGAMGIEAALATGLLGFLRCEFVCRAPRVSGPASLPTSLAGLIGGKLVRAPLRVSGLSTFAGDLPLLLAIHGGKSPAALFGHRLVPFPGLGMHNRDVGIRPLRTAPAMTRDQQVCSISLVQQH
jgi:hypothetical protein